jgi:membrane fusion protein, multidrug efflux system
VAVQVSQPVLRQVGDYLDFAGRTQAVNSVEIRARVSGFLVKTAFKEGAEVRKGDLLYEIDPRPYQVNLENAEAALNLSELHVKRAAAELDRLKELIKKGVVSREELEKVAGDHAEALAAVRVPRAAVVAAQLELSFTRVTAPIDGVIGRSLQSLGNLVKADLTALAHLVTLDPMYVYFDMDEVTTLRLRVAINNGKLKEAVGGKQPLLLKLAGEADYAHQGTIDFIDNQIDPKTGTLTVRAVCANPRPAAGVRLMAPGMFARVRLPIGEPHDALLVTERAIKSEQGIKHVWVASANKVELRRVTTGALQQDGLRVIAVGLKAEEWVVVGGLSKLKAGAAVDPAKVPMPTEGPTGAGAK